MPLPHLLKTLDSVHEYRVYNAADACAKVTRQPISSPSRQPRTLALSRRRGLFDWMRDGRDRCAR